MPYELQEFKNWIDAGESAYGKVKPEYDKGMEYTENMQEPSGTPSDKEYVTYNLITYRSRRRIGEMLAARKQPILLGAGEMTELLVELFNDILDENRFNTSVFPSALHHFYPVGFAGLKFIEDPRKLSKYGIGSPVIEWLRHNELRLDPTARDPYHADDKFRYHVKRVTLEYAREKWKDYASKINESGMEDEMNDATGIRHVNVYDMEYCKPEFRQVESGEFEVANNKTGTPKKDANGNPVMKMIEVERDVYYQTKIINKHVQVMRPTATGYPVFRLTPMIHTPRTATTKGGYPFGLYALLGQGQDLLNVTYSVLLDAIKSVIKMAVIATGVMEDEQEEHKRQLAKTNAYIASQNSAAKIQVVTGPQLPPTLTEFADRIRFMIDEIDNVFAPDRGQVSGDLSGKAISNLQQAGAIPEITAQVNIENALTDLAINIFHYIRTNMTGEFSINRRVGLEEMEIPFNRAVPRGLPSSGPFHIVKGGYVNDIRKLPRNMRVKVAVELNHNAKRAEDINVALLLRERGDLALKDELKTLFPMSWEEKMANVLQENKVMSLVNDIAQTDPNAVDQLAEMWQQIKPELQEASKQLEGSMNGGRR